MMANLAQSWRAAAIRILTRRQSRWLLPLLLAAVLCPISAMLVDSGVALYMRAHQDNWIVETARRITKYGDAWRYMLGIAILFFASYLFRDVTLLGKTALLRARGLYIFLTMAISSLAGEILAMILGRPRPHLLLDQGLYHLSWLSGLKPYDSMPSSHATSVLAFSFAAALAFRPARWIFIGYGLAMASTRVLIGAHFVSDVIASAALSGAIALFLHRYLMQAGRAIASDDEAGWAASALTTSASAHHHVHHHVVSRGSAHRRG